MLRSHDTISSIACGWPPRVAAAGGGRYDRRVCLQPVSAIRGVAATTHSLRSPHATRTIARDNRPDHRRRGLSGPGAGGCRGRPHSRPDPEGRPGRGGNRVRSRAADRGVGPGRHNEPGLRPHPVPDAGRGRLGAPRPQRSARAAVHHRRERDGTGHVPGRPHPRRRLRRLDVPQRDRAGGGGVPPAVRRRRHAGVRQVLHGVQRPVGQRPRGLPGRRRREPRERDPRVDDRRSGGERVQRHLAGGLPDRPVRVQPQHRHHRVQSDGRRGVAGLRAPLCQPRGCRGGPTIPATSANPSASRTV